MALGCSERIIRIRSKKDMNFELKAEIIEVNLDTVDINGFKYNLHLMRVGTHERFKVLLQSIDSILEIVLFLRIKL